MNSKLQYFINKPCTILTSPINRNFTEKQLLDYFTGFVESVDSEGILLRQLVGGQKSYIFLNNIISIAEEAVETTPIAAESVPQKQSKVDKYINPDALANLSQQMKQKNNI